MLRISLFCILACLNLSLGTKHTQVYLDYKAGRFKDTIFLKNTFIPQQQKAYYDPCRNITRPEYIQILKNLNIKCSGSWCIDGEFKCKSGDSINCYNMEHIIDRKNSIEETFNLNKDILGNVLMAYGKWNQQVGNLPTWDDIKAEKMEIYGSDIFNTALYYVKMCSKPESNSNLGSESNLNSGSNSNLNSNSGTFLGSTFTLNANYLFLLTFVFVGISIFLILTIIDVLKNIY